MNRGHNVTVLKVFNLTDTDIPKLASPLTKSDPLMLMNSDPVARSGFEAEFGNGLAQIVQDGRFGRGGRKF